MMFEKIKFNIGQIDEFRQINFFSYPILEYSKSKNNKRNILFFPRINKNVANNKEIFYLKVNRNEAYSIFLCCLVFSLFRCELWVSVLKFL